jgi:glycosyltransferase involved in cell wall biosynthesis
MRILMLVPRGGLRGPVPKHTSHLVESLRSLDCVVTTQPWSRAAETEPLATKIAQRFRDVLDVRRAVGREHFDVAVVKTAHDWRTILRDIAVVLAIRRRCRPIVIQFHGSRSSILVTPGHRAFKLATKILIGLVDAAMVLSHEEQRQWQQFRRSVPTYVVKNPYIRALAPRSPSPQSAADRRRAPGLLFVGRLMKAKGVFHIVDALPIVLRQTTCHLFIVGEGSDAGELGEWIRRRGLNDHVTLTGFLSGPDLTRMYTEAAVFVLPTSWGEGFPTVLSEAMDAGLAIVTTPIRGAADHLLEGRNTLFVNPHDVDALAAAIVRLLSDSLLRTRMAAANRELLRKFEPDVVAAEYLEVLEEVVGARRIAEAAA